MAQGSIEKHEEAHPQDSRQDDKNKDDKQARVVRAIRALRGTVSTYERSPSRRLAGAARQVVRILRQFRIALHACSRRRSIKLRESMPPNKDSACKWKASLSRRARGYEAPRVSIRAPKPKAETQPSRKVIL